ncbi:hypothetical protein [Pyrobaculum sp.]|uniref:hypothetical protein n=1 Tax=Pyrobaculum sp. TaxID=2004705 RepID=UPI003166B9DC
MLIGQKALDSLEEIARARGSHDLLDEYMRLAEEAGLADPSGVSRELTLLLF